MKPTSTILVVDDETANTTLLGEVLKKAGYSVNSANDGFKAIAACKVRTPDCIVLDLHMPLMGGMEVYNRLRSEEKTAAIPIIFLAARDKALPSFSGDDASNEDIIFKPVEPNELLSRVKSVLKEKHLRDELRRFLDHPPDAAALALARERLASRWVLASQRRGDRSLQLARGLLFGQADPALGDDSPAELIRKLDPETLQAVAKRYLREDRLLRAVVLPDSQRIALGNRGASLRANEPSPLSPTADSAR